MAIKDPFETYANDESSFASKMLGVEVQCVTEGIIDATANGWVTTPNTQPGYVDDRDATVSVRSLNIGHPGSGKRK